jgi:hypothetical protein
MLYITMTKEGDNVVGASDPRHGIEDPQLREAATKIRGLAHRVTRQKQARLMRGILGVGLHAEKLTKNEEKLNTGPLAHFLLPAASLVVNIKAQAGNPGHAFYKTALPEGADNQAGIVTHVLQPTAFELYARSSGEACKQVDRLSIITVYSAAALAVSEVLSADVLQPGSLDTAPVLLSREVWLPDSFVRKGTVLHQTMPEEAVAGEAQAFADLASVLFVKRSNAGGNRYQ